MLRSQYVCFWAAALMTHQLLNSRAILLACRIIRSPRQGVESSLLAILGVSSVQKGTLFCTVRTERKSRI